MKLYVCYGTWTLAKPLHAHPCGEAHEALVEAGYRPQVIRSYGWGMLTGAVNDLTPGRRAVKEMTGNHWVPALVTNDGTVVQGSGEIIEWAQAHPAPVPGGAGRRSGPGAGDTAGAAADAG
jgi:hypothetical protein